MASKTSETDTTAPQAHTSRSGRFRLPVNILLATSGLLIWAAVWFVYAR